MEFYPPIDFGPLMPGLVIGLVGIVHVFLAQLAVGGGFVLGWIDFLGARGREPAARAFVDGFFRTIVLTSFVLGALTGVGIWLTAIQVSPPTIGLLVREFHWIWAAEWCFFALEIVAGYAFYRHGPRLADRPRRTLLALYTLAAWMSLVLINGILSFQLTPGHWLETGALVDGFFNPSFWPSLLYRTVSSIAVAALIAMIVVRGPARFEERERRSLVRHLAYLLAPMVLMAPLGAWYLAAMPPDSRSWVLGGSPAMSLFLAVAAAASGAIGLYALLGLLPGRHTVNAATATLLAGLAFAATAGGEFVREGARKPFTVRGVLYSNGVSRDAVPALREEGLATRDPYPLDPGVRYPSELVALGAKTLRDQCGACHTLEGVNSIAHLTATWTSRQLRLNLAQLQRTKPFMPPFAGTPRELEGLCRLIEWHRAGRPEGGERPAPTGEELQRLAEWLTEAGPWPAGEEFR